MPYIDMKKVVIFIRLKSFFTDVFKIILFLEFSTC